MTTIGQITGVVEKKYKPMEGNDVIMRTANAFGQKEVDGYNSCLQTEVEVDIIELGQAIRKNLDTFPIDANWTVLRDRGIDYQNLIYKSINTIAEAIEKGGVIKLKEQK